MPYQRFWRFWLCFYFNARGLRGSISLVERIAIIARVERFLTPAEDDENDKWKSRHGNNSPNLDGDQSLGRCWTRSLFSVSSDHRPINQGTPDILIRVPLNQPQAAHFFNDPKKKSIQFIRNTCIISKIGFCKISNWRRKRPILVSVIFTHWQRVFVFN